MSTSSVAACWIRRLALVLGTHATEHTTCHRGNPEPFVGWSGLWTPKAPCARSICAAGHQVGFCATPPPWTTAKPAVSSKLPVACCLPGWARVCHCDHEVRSRCIALVSQSCPLCRYGHVRSCRFLLEILHSRPTLPACVNQISYFIDIYSSRHLVAEHPPPQVCKHTRAAETGANPLRVSGCAVTRITRRNTM